jgi:hypothetical protein
MKMNLPSKNARDNVVMNGKLYIPRDQWCFWKSDNGTEQIHFNYMAPGTRFCEPCNSIANWHNESLVGLQDFARVLKIKGFSKMNKDQLSPLVWSNIVLEGHEQPEPAV